MVGFPCWDLKEKIITMTVQAQTYLWVANVRVSPRPAIYLVSSRPRLDGKKYLE